MFDTSHVVSNAVTIELIILYSSSLSDQDFNLISLSRPISVWQYISQAGIKKKHFALIWVHYDIFLHRNLSLIGHASS